MRAVKAWLQLEVYYRSNKIQSIEICLLLRVFSPTRGAVLNAPPSQYGTWLERHSKAIPYVGL